MNNYKITFQRSNNSIGYDTFTDNSRQEAIQSFKACYRHDKYEILSIKIV